MSKIPFCHQKSKLVLFSHGILCCKTFQMTYYIFIYDVPNRSYVTLKYSSVGNYFWRKTQLKFGKYASLTTHTYSKAPTFVMVGHIYRLPDHIIIKLSRYLENSTKNMVPAHCNTLFNSLKVMSV